METPYTFYRMGKIYCKLGKALLCTPLSYKHKTRHWLSGVTPSSSHEVGTIKSTPKYPQTRKENKQTISIMTSYALSLMVVVVDPWRLALVCRNDGGKQTGKPAGQKCYRDELDIKNKLTEEGVPGASYNLN